MVSKKIERFVVFRTIVKIEVANHFTQNSVQKNISKAPKNVLDPIMVTNVIVNDILVVLKLI